MAFMVFFSSCCVCGCKLCHSLFKLYHILSVVRNQSRFFLRFPEQQHIQQIREMGYPVFSCGTTQVTGKYRMECVEMNGPITLCGKLVEPGDLMVADDSGVCIVPAELAEAVIEEAEKIAASEERMRQLIEEKKPISELRPLFRARYK